MKTFEKIERKGIKKPRKKKVFFWYGIWITYKAITKKPLEYHILKNINR